MSGNLPTLGPTLPSLCPAVPAATYLVSSTAEERGLAGQGPKATLRVTMAESKGRQT